MKNEKFGNRIQDLSKDNKGSTIVMVLVAFFFVSVLVAIIMATVVANFRMRTIDRKTKDEFYYAEKALNDVYAGLGENCAKALGNSYNVTMSKYAADEFGTYQNQVQAYDAFCVEYLDAIYASADPTTGGTYGLSLNPRSINKDELIAKMNSYIVGNRAKVTNIGNIYYYGSDKKTEVPLDENKKMYPSIKYTVIKNVKVLSNMTSADNTGYMSGVTADIVIETPQIDFFTVNEEDVEYALAASDGIEFNGNGDITGSVYGGSRVIPEINIPDKVSATGKLMSDASDYGGILVNGSNVSITGKYVVSGGDLYIKKDGSNAGSLTINNGTKNEIWFDNLTVEGNDSSVNIKGDLYAMGDLQVEGEGANVKIKGNYYGYNNGTHESKTDYLLAEADRSKKNDSSKFSSIIVNAKKATVKMDDDLDTLVLLGKAYINYNSKRTDDSNSLKPLDGSNNLVSDIGESVALKSGQDIFLCPSEFLKGNTNPAEIENEGFHFTIDTTKMQNWFGYQYLDPRELTKTVKLQKNGINRAYCYLNFKGNTAEEISKNQQAYIERIVNSRIKPETNTGCEPKPETILNRLERANRLQDSQILIGNAETRIYANGSVVEYKRKEKSIDENNRDVPSLGTVNVKGNTADFTRFANYSDSMHYKYQRLCTYLDPMTNSSISVNNGKDVSTGDYDNKNLPFGRLFWLNGMGDAATKNYNGSDSTVIVCSGGTDDIFYDGRGSAVDIVQKLIDNGITPNGSENVFMIIDGDAYVKENVTINGFIYVNGELIVDKDKTLKVSYSSTLLDRRIEAELKKLKEDYAQRTNRDMKPEAFYQQGTLIYYLLKYTLPDGSNSLSPDVGTIDNSTISRYRKYVIDPETGDVAIDVTSDYTQFMYFENWRKGL